MYITEYIYVYLEYIIIYICTVTDFCTVAAHGCTADPNFILTPVSDHCFLSNNKFT